jgi:DNA-binding transcriptional ArsR family regulator
MRGIDEDALRAIASPRRRQILRLVWTRELSSGDIASRLDATWPAVSQNLRVLETAGLVRGRRRGTARLYRANRSGLGPLKTVLTRMWEADLDRLAELAETEERPGSRPAGGDVMVP